jgi:hypothetical protein
MDLVVTMGREGSARLRLPLSESRHTTTAQLQRYVCTLYKSGSILKRSIFVCSILHTLFILRVYDIFCNLSFVFFWEWGQRDSLEIPRQHARLGGPRANPRRLGPSTLV